MSSVLLNPDIRSLEAVSAPRRESFDVTALTGFLDGEFAALKSDIRAVLRQPQFGYRYDIDRTSYRDLILRRCHELARHGWGAALFPDGTRSGDVPKFLAAFETIGVSDPNLLVKFGLQFGLFGGAILYLGTRRHHEQYLPKVASMELVGCYAMTELGHGSDTRRLQTIATYDVATDEFLIDTPAESACKQFIGNAALHASMAIVFAQLEVREQRHGVFGFLVPIRDGTGALCRGVRVGDSGQKAGLLGIDNGWIRFDRVRIPRANLLDRFGSVTREGEYCSDVVEDPTALIQRCMSGGRIAIALGALSAAKSGLTIAIRYGAQRRQFGKLNEHLLLDYPLHQRRLLPRLAQVFALDFALKHASSLARDINALTDPAFEELAALLKAYSTWSAVDTLGQCREACGGQGYLAVNRVGVLRADIDPMTTLEGDNHLLYLLVGKALLKRLQERIRGGAWRATASELLALSNQRAALRLRLRLHGLRGVRGAESLLRLVRYRERALCLSVLRRLSRDGRGPGADYQSPLIELAQASAERLVLEQCWQLVQGAPQKLEGVLLGLRDLYAATCVLDHSVWYAQAALLTRAQLSHLERYVTDLCNLLRPHAVSLVNSFAIPEECLGAPIARTDMSPQLEI
jgi:acyl-CoA oxidase